MRSFIFVPETLKAAAEHHCALAVQLDHLPKRNFIRAWSSVAYLFPGLNPDGFEDADIGWPRVLRRFAAEAWHRAEAGDLAGDKLYVCDAQWAGIYDRMTSHTPEERRRRRKIAAHSTRCAHA